MMGDNRVTQVDGNYKAKDICQYWLMHFIGKSLDSKGVFSVILER